MRGPTARRRAGRRRFGGGTSPGGSRPPGSGGARNGADDAVDGQRLVRGGGDGRAGRASAVETGLGSTPVADRAERRSRRDPPRRRPPPCRPTGARGRRCRARRAGGGDRGRSTAQAVPAPGQRDRSGDRGAAVIRLSNQPGGGRRRWSDRDGPAGLVHLVELTGDRGQPATWASRSRARSGVSSPSARADRWSPCSVTGSPPGRCAGPSGPGGCGCGRCRPARRADRRSRRTGGRPRRTARLRPGSPRAGRAVRPGRRRGAWSPAERLDVAALGGRPRSRRRGVDGRRWRRRTSSRKAFVVIRLNQASSDPGR